MILKKLKDFYMKTVRLRKYNNAVEAVHYATLLRRYSGASVFELISLPGKRIGSRFSVIGFMCLLFWMSVYLYCTYKSLYEDQTILRMLYNTKLKRYGDDYERISSIVFVMLTIILTPFRLSGNRFAMQELLDIDSVIEKAGGIVDYHRMSRTALFVSLAQTAIYFIRIFCIYVALSSSIVMPLEKMFQVVYADALALVTTVLYCYYLINIRDRFIWINGTLSKIREVIVRGKVPVNIIKVAGVQDRHVCERIKTCARVYSMLFHTCKTINKIFGLALLITMVHYCNYVILYLFYFMEATASGLFHDLERYIDFLVYTFWEIAIALGVIFLMVCFSESTMAQAKKTSFITHQIINEGVNLSINSEAMQLSIQLLHQGPVFSVCGLFNFDYAFLQQGMRSVLTYLVILLQFATDNTSS